MSEESATSDLAESQTRLTEAANRRPVGSSREVQLRYAAVACGRTARSCA
jgi:hypothetical protein